MNILITGKNSYIGNSLEQWFKTHLKQCNVYQLDVRDEDWNNFDFSNYDTVIHVAGIVHQPKIKKWSIYEKVNINLPYKIAQKAKASGVKQFVFFSTMAVYGARKKIRGNIIDSDSILLPRTLYGKSKLEAERKIKTLQTNSFLISFIRPSNVYGYKCKGNYMKYFVKMSKSKIPFPHAFFDTKQAVLNIYNLCYAVQYIIEKRKDGIFCLQDKMTVSAIEIVKTISSVNGKTKKTSKFLGFFVYLFSFLPFVRKIYGGVCYSSRLANIGFDYNLFKFDEAIEKMLRV